LRRYVRITLANKPIEQFPDGGSAGPVECDDEFKSVDSFTIELAIQGFVEKAIQGRDYGPGLWPNTAQGLDCVASEDGCLPISIGALNRTDERWHGCSRRRANPSEGSRRTDPHVSVRTIQDVEEGRHGWTADLDQSILYAWAVTDRTHRLVPEDLPPSRDCLPAERAFFIRPGRLKPKDHDEKGREDSCHENCPAHLVELEPKDVPM